MFDRHAPSGSALVGEVDEDADAELDLNSIMAEPLKAVIH